LEKGPNCIEGESGSNCYPSSFTGRYNLVDRDRNSTEGEESGKALKV
jgi:hypothetical protein